MVRLQLDGPYAQRLAEWIDRERSKRSQPVDLGVNDGTISRWRNGETTNIDHSTLHAVAEGLELPLWRVYLAAGYIDDPQAPPSDVRLAVNNSDLPDSVRAMLLDVLDFADGKDKTRKRKTVR